jgi:inhibitor of KinA
MAKLLIEPLGDQAALVTLPDETGVVPFVAAVRDLPVDWLVDVVPAYATVAVFFDLLRADYAAVAAALQSLRGKSGQQQGQLHKIPCCYEREKDLARVAEAVGLSCEEVIALHTASDFTVFAIGFCPGFPYLGYLPKKLQGVPRLPAPRLRVEAGSVGLTGVQTGIYPLPRPGGWNLIGQTPLELVSLEDGYFPIRVGDRVRFQRIDEVEFARLYGERL